MSTETEQNAVTKIAREAGEAGARIVASEVIETIRRGDIMSSHPRVFAGIEYPPPN